MQSTKRILQGISLSALIALCGISSLQSQHVKQPKPVMAVDAQGKEIGTVLRMDYSQHRMQVALEVNDTLVPILVKKGSFSHSYRPMAYFRSDDCTGVAYLGNGSGEKTFGPIVGVAGPRATLYWGYPETRQLRQMGSSMVGEECREFQVAIMAIDADALMDLADEFLPPFGIAPGSQEDSRGSGRSNGRGRD